MSENTIEFNREDGDTRLVIELTKPFEWEGKTYNELHFDLEGLTGADIVAVDNEVRALGRLTSVREFDADFQCRLAARACSEKNIGEDALKKLPANVFNKLLNRVRRFLLDTES